MKIPLFFLIFFTLLGTQLFGQETLKKHSLKLSTGLSQLSRQDLIFSPFIHKDITFMNAGIGYTKEAALFHEVELRYANFTPSVTNAYEFYEDGEEKISNPHFLTFITLDYLIGKKMISGKISFTAGAILMTEIQALNYVYGRFSNFGYYASTGVGAFGRYGYELSNKSNLSMTMKLPVVSWYARSPYLVNDDEFIENISSHSGFKTFMSFLGDGDLTSWNRLQYFDIEADYTFDLSERWIIGAAYLFEFIHSSKPRTLLSFRNSVNLSVYHKF